MNAVLDRPSVETEIADCCRVLFWMAEPELAMSNWARLGKLAAQRAQAQDAGAAVGVQPPELSKHLP